MEDSTPIVPIKPQDQTIDTALRLPREQSEHVARHSEGQDVSHLAMDADKLQEFFQCSSPVTRLPPEILAYIFELYMGCLGEMTFDGVLAHGPIRFTQVCKLWRVVVESDPHLWTWIHLHFPESHQSRTEDVPRIRSVLDQHLNRSGALPVSLTFTDYRTYHSATEELISFLVDRLRKHAQRWKRISLQLQGAYFPQLFTFTPCDLSSLEHLYISGDVFTQSATLHLDLESATSLKSFTYSGPGPSVEDRIYLHWESLEEVSFEFAPHYGGSYTLSRQFRHLAQCQNITTCSLGIDRASLRLHSSQPITLPCLQTLRVRRLSPLGHASSAIDLLILPQLQTLEIDASVLVSWNQRWHSHNFSGLLSRSGCSLLHLSIQDVYFPNDELVQCLALSPALRSLRFIPCPRSQDIRDVMRKLDISRTPTGARWNQSPGQRQVPNSGPLVPQLREITLASSVEKYLGSMTAMLRARVGPRARAAGVATLRRIGVVFFDMWHDMGVDRVRDPGHSEKLESFRAELAQLVSENRNENGREDGDGLEASMIVDSPYLPEYVTVQYSS